MENIVAQELVYTYVVSGDSLSSNVPLNEINPKAFRHFTQSYGYVSSQEWRKYSNGFSVSFRSHDSTVYRVFYSLHGAAGIVHVYYTAAGTPTGLIDTLDPEYKGCRVVYSAGLIDGQKEMFEVGLLVNNKIRIVQVREGYTKTIIEYDVSDPAFHACSR
jgi:hypothetical protein